jgi:hypothetical protein
MELASHVSASLLDDRSPHSSMLHSQTFEAAVIATLGAALLMTPASAPAFATAFGASVCCSIVGLPRELEQDVGGDRCTIPDTGFSFFVSRGEVSREFGDARRALRVLP